MTENEVREYIRQEAHKAGVSPHLLFNIQAAEGGKELDAAINPSSHTKGRFQFMDTTWASTVRQAGLPADASPHDPLMATKAVIHLIKSNREVLKASGYKGPFNAAIDYAMHVLGGKDGPKFFKALHGNPFSDATAHAFLKGPASQNRSYFFRDDGQPCTLSEVYNHFADKMDAPPYGPTAMAWPTDYHKITSDFGLRDTGISGASKNHKGTDVKGPAGSAVYAPLAGTIIGVRPMVEIDANGKVHHAMISIRTSQNAVINLLHVNADENIRPGMKVRQGQKIARVAETEPETNGPHVHTMLVVNGVPRDIEPHFRNSGTKQKPDYDAVRVALTSRSVYRGLLASRHSNIKTMTRQAYDKGWRIETSSRINDVKIRTADPKTGNRNGVIVVPAGWNQKKAIDVVGRKCLPQLASLGFNPKSYTNWTIQEKQNHLKNHVLPSLLKSLPGQANGMGPLHVAVTAPVSHTLKDTIRDNMQSVLGPIPHAASASPGILKTAFDDMLSKPVARHTEISFLQDRSAQKGFVSLDGSKIEIPSGLPYNWTVYSAQVLLARAEFRQMPVVEQLKFRGENDYVKGCIGAFANAHPKLKAFMEKALTKDKALKDDPEPKEKHEPVNVAGVQRSREKSRQAVHEKGSRVAFNKESHSDNIYREHLKAAQKAGTGQPRMPAQKPAAAHPATFTRHKHKPHHSGPHLQH